MKQKELIVNPYFICGLFVLLLNDWYLKYEFSNFITGKLSDFAGLLIFPMFIAFLFPAIKRYISMLTGCFFLLWKLPLMTPVIDSVNYLSFITIERVIDYSDYFALLILPLSHYLINHSDTLSVVRLHKLKSVTSIFLLGVAFFAFCATSVAPHREMPQGSIYIGESYNIKLSKDSIISTIKQLGYNCEYYPDSVIPNMYDSYFVVTAGGYYQTDNIIRFCNSDSIHCDTIANIKYELTEINPHKSKLTLINVTLSKKGNIQNWRVLKSLSKQYDQWIKGNLIEKLDKKTK
jgi:hypothetical protein